MEKIPQITPQEAPPEHQEISAVLGRDYIQGKIDAIVAVIGFKQALKEIKNIRSSTNPIQRHKYVKEWYESHQDALDIFGK